MTKNKAEIINLKEPLTILILELLQILKRVLLDFVITKLKIAVEVQK